VAESIELLLSVWKVKVKESYCGQVMAEILTPVAYLTDVICIKEIVHVWFAWCCVWIIYAYLWKSTSVSLHTIVIICTSACKS